VHLDGRHEHLGWADELEHLGPVGVVDGELVRQELVDAGDQAKELARFRLPLLPDRANRRAGGIYGVDPLAGRGLGKSLKGLRVPHRKRPRRMKPPHLRGCR